MANPERIERRIIEAIKDGCPECKAPLNFELEGLSSTEGYIIRFECYCSQCPVWIPTEEFNWIPIGLFPNEVTRENVFFGRE